MQSMIVKSINNNLSKYFKLLMHTSASLFTRMQIEVLTVSQPSPPIRRRCSAGLHQTELRVLLDTVSTIQRKFPPPVSEKSLKLSSGIQETFCLNSLRMTNPIGYSIREGRCQST